MRKDEVVATTFGLSSKEMTIKQRFLSNQRSATPRQQINPTPQQITNPQMTSFLNDMNSVIHQTSNPGQDIMARQTNIMQQQVEMLRENQKNLQQIMQTVITRPQETGDSRRVIAEMLAPLSKQVLDVKSYYEETKKTANDIAQQVSQLKLAMENQSGTQEQQETVRRTMGKFQQNKQKFNSKVREAEALVEGVMDNVQANLSNSEYTNGIMYLKSQIEAISSDTERVEKELYTRFQRILEQCEKMKSLPQEFLNPQADYKGGRSRMIEALGGEFDYEGLFNDLDQIKFYKNELIKEYRLNTPNYPKYQPKTQPKEYDYGFQDYQQPKREVRKKPTTMLPPQPVVQPTKVIRKKPENLAGIVTQPKSIIKSRKKQPVKKPQVVQQTAPAASQKPTVIEEPAIVKKPTVIQKPIEPQQVIQKEERIPTPTPPPSLPDDYDTSPPKHEDPKPFQKLPTTVQKKPPQKKIDNVKKQKFPTVIQTHNAPYNKLEQGTLDLVTHYILQHQLGVHKKYNISTDGALSKWLGQEELSQLIQMGVQFDNNTIEQIGRQVLLEEITRIKNIKIDDIDESVEELPSDTKEDQSDYYSDFEEAEEEKQDKVVDSQDSKPYNSSSQDNKSSMEVRSSNLTIASPRVQTPVIFSHQDEIERPKAPLINDIQDSDEFREPGDLNELLSAKVIGKMSAAAVHKYVSALVESGHISRKSQVVEEEEKQIQPEVQQISIEKQVENSLPPELQAFFNSEAGRRLFYMIQQEGKHMTAQQIMQRFVELYFKPPQQGLQLLEVQSQNQIGTNEKEVFGQLQTPKITHRPGFNAETEERKILQENQVGRRQFKIPLFETNDLYHTEIKQNFQYSESELSGLSSKSSNIGSDIFQVENPEFINGFIDYVRRAQEIQSSTINYDFSEGEINASDSGMESGEVPADVFSISLHSGYYSQRQERINLQTSDLLQEDYERSEGEIDPYDIFKVN